MKRLSFATLCAFWLTTSLHAAESPAKVTFQDHVRAIFRESCCACHSQDDAASGLALDDYGAAIGGGAGGEVLAAGVPDDSRLWRLVTHQEGPNMPPGEKLPDDQLAVIKRWIEGGLLDNAGSKPKKPKRSGIGEVVVSTDNRPLGEPATPIDWFHEPVVSADRVGPITALAASPWAPLVAIPWQRQVSLYRTDNLQLAGVLPYPDGAPRVVRFSRDGSLMLVAGGRGASFGSAAVFDVKTGTRLVTVGEELDEVLAADISPNQALVAIGGPKKKVRVYRAADGSLAYELGKHTDWITALQFSPDSKLLATSDRSAGLLVWQADTGNPRGDLRGHKQAITSVDWRTDSAALASSSEDGEVRLWRPDGQLIKNFRAHSGGVSYVAFSQDGKLVTAGRDRKITTWSADGKVIKQLGPMKDIALAAAYTFDGKKVVASDFAGNVQLFDADSGKAAGQLAPNPPTLSTRLARAKTDRDAVASKLMAAQAAATESAEQLAAARATHNAYNKQLAEAEAAAQQALKQLDATKQAHEAALASKEVAAKTFVVSTDVRKAAEQALSVAEKRLSEVTSSDTEESPGAVIQSLMAAVKHAKEEEALQAKSKADAENHSQQTVESLKSATETKKKSEQTLASVRSQQQGLPDLKAVESAAKSAASNVKTLRGQLTSFEKEIASLEAELKLFTDAKTQYAAEVEIKEDELGRLATLASKTQTAQSAAQVAEQKVQVEIDALTKKLAELQQQLDRGQESRKQAQAEVARLTKEAEDIVAKLREAELATSRAKTRQADFEAAEKARKAYLKKP